MYAKEILKKTKITRDALRHYNDIGLVVPKVNPDNNYKEYTPSDIDTILFVKKAQKIGFTLNEIHAIAEHMKSSTCKHQSLIPFLEGHREEIDEKISTLKKMRKHINFLIKDFEKRDCSQNPSALDL